MTNHFDQFSAKVWSTSPTK